jgi:hypothetical protein
MSSVFDDLQADLEQLIKVLEEASGGLTTALTVEIGVRAAVVKAYLNSRMATWKEMAGLRASLDRLTPASLQDVLDCMGVYQPTGAERDWLRLTESYEQLKSENQLLKGTIKEKEAEAQVIYARLDEISGLIEESANKVRDRDQLLIERRRELATAQVDLEDSEAVVRRCKSRMVILYVVLAFLLLGLVALSWYGLKASSSGRANTNGASGLCRADAREEAGRYVAPGVAAIALRRPSGASTDRRLGGTFRSPAMMAANGISAAVEGR